jgi:hypothetical protein
MDQDLEQLDREVGHLDRDFAPLDRVFGYVDRDVEHVDHDFAPERRAPESTSEEPETRKWRPGMLSAVRVTIPHPVALRGVVVEAGRHVLLAAEPFSFVQPKTQRGPEWGVGKCPLASTSTHVRW